MAAAAADKVVEIISRPGMMDHVRAMGDRLRAGLDAALGQSPHVGDIRGRGLFLGIELVADKDGKTPFDPALRMHARVKAEAMARGLLCYPAGGTIDGRRGDHVLLAPPYIVAPGEIDMIVERMRDAIGAAVKGV